MKTLVIVFACLLLPGLAAGRCGVEVINAQGAPVITPQLSSPTARITVSRDGKPLVGAKVDIYEYMAEKHPLFSVTTPDNGVVALPNLMPGHFYHIVAVGVPEMSADLYIQIAEDATVGAAVLSMNVPRSRKLLAAEGMAPSSRLKEFTGVLGDESGGRIPAAFVDIWKKGTTSGPPLEEIRSDDLGRFSAQLPDGMYIALFSSPGFVSSAVVFEIANAADVKDLQVTLEVGACT